MTYSRYAVAHAISMRDFVDMSSTGNILLGSDRHILNVRQMIMGKILPQHANGWGQVEIHIRLSNGANWDDQRDDLMRLIEAGNSVYVWMTQQEAERLDVDRNSINPVIIDHSFPVAAENFMIVTSPLEARSLIWWVPGQGLLVDDSADPSVYGVLITDPDETRRLLVKIRAVLIHQGFQKRE